MAADQLKASLTIHAWRAGHFLEKISRPRFLKQFICSQKKNIIFSEKRRSILSKCDQHYFKIPAILVLAKKNLRTPLEIVAEIESEKSILNNLKRDGLWMADRFTAAVRL